MMRIVHVTSGYLPDIAGGVQVHVRDLCRGLRSRGHEVEVFTWFRGPGSAELAMRRSDFDGVRVTQLTNNFHDLERFEQLYSHPAIDDSFGSYLDEMAPDLVHVHHLTGLSTSMIESARRRGLPVVMSLHDYWMVCPRGQRIRPSDLEICESLDRARCLPCLNELWPHLLPRTKGVLGGWGKPIDRLLGRRTGAAMLADWEAHVHRMLQQCQALTMPSDFHRARFVEWGVDEARAFTVPYGLDTQRLRGEPRGRSPVRRIGYIGTVIPTKGVHVLCDAFERLGRDDLQLDIYGEAIDFHGDSNYLERLRRSLSPGAKVRFHGRYEQEQVGRILADVDLLVVPSIWWESFCLTVREGVLAGVPVIASRIGGMQEAVDADLALGFRAGDPADLARVIERVTDDADLRDRMSRKADGVRGIEENAREMEGVYEFAASQLGRSAA